MRNPYENSAPSETDVHRRSTHRWVAVGGLALSSFTLLLSVYAIYIESVAEAALPPGTPRCGMGMLSAMIIAFVGGPIMGAVGALAGWAASKLCPFFR